ncbi:MAG: hypothetical protein QOF02_3182 [Blastocatellia bacterium]|jgi:hypothetical protein|nr:hypothetical protein [Blastocatellia bacterium]
MSMYYRRGAGMGELTLAEIMQQGLRSGIIAGGYAGAVPAGRSFIFSTLATLSWTDTLTLTKEETMRQRIYSYLSALGTYSGLNVAFTSGWTSGGIKITGKTLVARVDDNDILIDCLAAIRSAGADASPGQSTIAIGTNIPGQYTGSQPLPGQYDDGQTGHNVLDFLNPANFSGSTLAMLVAGLIVVIWIRD